MCHLFKNMGCHAVIPSMFCQQGAKECFLDSGSLVSQQRAGDRGVCVCVVGGEGMEEMLPRKLVEPGGPAASPTSPGVLYAEPRSVNYFRDCLNLHLW